MNIHVTPPGERTTQAAEGLPRWRHTVADVRRMVEAGIIAETERLELIGGELVPMSPKGMFHENVKRVLNRHWAKALPDDLDMLTETTLHIDDDEFREPDFVFWPRSIPIRDLKAAGLLLLVEVADSSLGYDLGLKQRHYARFGVREYWVIDAKRLVTHVHRRPVDGGYGAISRFAHTDRIMPELAPALAVRLADLDVEPARE
jgi:Uma2 family endonuclease